MPNIVPQLDMTRSYIYCSQCQAQFGQKIEMKRDGHLVKCQFGHTMEHTRLGGQLEMVPLQITEVPSERAVKREFWVIPEVYEKLQQKFAGRFLVTMGTFFDNLANDSIIFINGDEAKKLKESGIRTGAEMAAMAQTMKDQEERLIRQQILIDKVKPILQAAGVEAGV